MGHRKMEGTHAPGGNWWVVRPTLIETYQIPPVEVGTKQFHAYSVLSYKGFCDTSQAVRMQDFRGFKKSGGSPKSEKTPRILEKKTTKKSTRKRTYMVDRTSDQVWFHFKTNICFWVIYAVVEVFAPHDLVMFPAGFDQAHRTTHKGQEEKRSIL